MKSYHNDEKRFKTKQRTKFTRTYDLLRQEELERQCEEFYMSLDCDDVKRESHEKDDDCDVLTPSLEKGQVEVHTRSLESKVICVKAQEEGLKGNELESKVGVKEEESLIGSSWNEPRRVNVTAVVLMCSCVGCARESHSHGLDELVGPKVGKVVTLVIVEVPWNLCSKGPCEKIYLALYPATQNLNFCVDSYLTVKANAHRGKICNLFTPHFHWDMLIRLMVGLVGINVVMNLIKWENDVTYLSLRGLSHMDLVYGYLVGDFGMNCCIVVMVTCRLWCNILPAILLSTWESVRRNKMEEHKHFHVQTHEANVGMKCHGGCLEGILAGHCQYPLDGRWGVPFQCCFKRLLAGCGMNENMRNPYEHDATDNRRMSQWVRSFLDYDSFWFNWLTMVTVGNGVMSCLWRCRAGTTGCCLLPSVERECISQVFRWVVMKRSGKEESFNLLWSVEKADKQYMDGGWDCRVLFMPWDSLESDNSKEEGISIFLTKEMHTWNCYETVFKDSNAESPSVKGTRPGLAYMINLGAGSIGGSELKQVPSGAAEFIRKYSPNINMGVKAEGGVDDHVFISVHSPLGIMRCIIRMRTPVAVTGHEFNLNIQGLGNNQMNCFLKKSDEDKLNQLFDAQDVSMDVFEWMIAWERTSSVEFIR